MSDTSKYDLFMDEIVSLEKMVQKFVVENEEIENEKSALEDKLDNLEQENEVLVLKIKELEKKLSQADDIPDKESKANLDFSERENLKSQIDDLISKIDYHIRS
jgi:predicted  nucleic acid-binding Zn-ribbon protein